MSCPQIVFMMRAVPSRSYPQIPEDASCAETACWCHRRSLHCRNSWIFDCRSSWVSRKCFQGSKSEAHHPTPLAARYPRWRRIGYTHQSHHRWWRCHPTHPQVPHQQIQQKEEAINLAVSSNTIETGVKPRLPQCAPLLLFVLFSFFFFSVQQLKPLFVSRWIHDV